MNAIRCTRRPLVVIALIAGVTGCSSGDQAPNARQPRASSH